MAATLLLAVMSGPLSARTVTTLSDGWTIDGTPVKIPHTWNALDAADGEGLSPTWPIDWYSAGSASYLRKAVVYRRQLPDKVSGKRYFFKCGGASINAKLCVNGVEVGRHVGSFTGFTFEMTDAMKAAGNYLELTVDNIFNPDVQPIHADYSVYGGLYRVPQLIVTDEVCIDPTRSSLVEANPDTGHVKITVPVYGGTKLVQEFDIADFELWSPENPKLYPITVKVGTDSQTFNVGFRKFEFRDDGFYLNGVKRKMRGVCRHQDRAGKGWGASAADEAEDIRWIKLMGADAVRTSHYPQSEEFFDLCDRNGILVWCELPFVNGLWFTEQAEKNERMMAREMVEQHRNHACIFAWGLFNEIYNKKMPKSPEPRLSAVKEYLNELDTSRPVIAASSRPNAVTLNKIPDVLGVNVYPYWYGSATNTMESKIAEIFHLNPTRKTVSISEYGAGGSPRQHGRLKERQPVTNGPYHPQEYQAYVHWKSYPAIKTDPRIWGSFLWVMFDLASDAKREGERYGINDKGMVSWDRMIAKDAFYFYKANWNPEPMLHLVGDRMTDTEDDKVDILAFSNSGDIELFVNDKSFGRRSVDVVNSVLWDQIPLKLGDNKIEVVSGQFREIAHWNRRLPDFPKLSKPRAVTKGPKEHFFASYSGINSWSYDTRYILALETDVNGRLSKENEPCTIGVIDTSDDNKFIPVSQTRAWNFQEAAMGHWLKWDRDVIAFNDYRDGKFVTVVMNWKTKEERVIPHPIAAVSPDGRKAISLNYARIRLTRPGYGYAGRGQDPLVGNAWPENDGLWLVDLMTGESKLIVPVSAVRGKVPEVGPNGLFYFCHVAFSRDGSRVFWLARGIDWYDAASEKAGPWTTTAFTCAVDGSDIRACFGGRDWGGSHFSWLDASTMAVTVYPKELPGTSWHVTFTVGKEHELPHRLAPGILDWDGHCTWSPDGRWMSTEGYYDKTRHRNWVLMRRADEATIPVGSFAVPKEYEGDWRCDLHARWRHDGRKLGFNSVHEGTRQIYVIDVGER